MEHESDCLILDWLPLAGVFVLYCDDEDGRKAEGNGFHWDPRFPDSRVTRKRKKARRYFQYATAQAKRKFLNQAI